VPHDAPESVNAQPPAHKAADAGGDAPPRPKAPLPPPAWGTESREVRLTRLLKKARALPDIPGVYLMKDHNDVVLYVGKASRQNDRVSSYFLPSADLGPRKQPLLDFIHDFEPLDCEG
jgi:hypothetical protein